MVRKDQTENQKNYYNNVRKQLIKCECGLYVKQHSMKPHLKSKKHQQILQINQSSNSCPKDN